jgi:carbonic anhydrase/acetyltransferase-like protein (isoleucine patch superfamily)
VPLSLGSDVTVGHNATLHGCTVEDQVLIGMGAIVLNRTHVGRHSIIAASAVLVEGQQIPGGVLVAGVPGKIRRELSMAWTKPSRLPGEQRGGAEHVPQAVPDIRVKPPRCTTISTLIDEEIIRDERL